MEKSAFATFNARADSVEMKPTFRSAQTTGECRPRLVGLDGGGQARYGKCIEGPDLRHIFRIDGRGSCRPGRRRGAFRGSGGLRGRALGWRGINLVPIRYDVRLKFGFIRVRAAGTLSRYRTNCRAR